MNTNPSIDRSSELELRQMIAKVNMLKNYNYTPQNVVLVTVDDIVEIMHELKPYTMSKLDEATQQAEQERKDNETI